MSGVLARWYPVTSEFGLILAPARAIATAYGMRGNAFRNSTRGLTGGLASAFEALAPLSMAKTRNLFVSTRSAWTAYFANGTQGSDPFGPMSELAKRFRITAMRVFSTSDGETMWDVYEHPAVCGNELGYRRSICVGNDGGWTFDQVGEPYAFEDLEAYKRKRKRDRFDRVLLDQYLRHFDIDAFNDEFYVVDPQHPAFLVERPRESYDQPEYSLEEVLAGVPWRRDED